jgi:hypothetical protein
MRGVASRRANPREYPQDSGEVDAILGQVLGSPEEGAAPPLAYPRPHPRLASASASAPAPAPASAPYFAGLVVDASDGFRRSGLRGT